MGEQKPLVLPSSFPTFLEIGGTPMTAVDHRPAYDLARIDGVRRKRIIAFLIDFTLVLLLSFVAGIFVFFLGIITLGLGWALYGGIIPLVAVFYSGISIANRGATPGMRAAGLTFRLETGEKPGFLQGAFHVILFYLTVSFSGGLILLVTFFNSRKRLLHDMLIGATVENE
jgi:uncharacterized RDD family membrane protein YckC